MAELIYPELSYTVQGAFYDVYNELRYLDLSEKGWESALLIALEERNVLAHRQVEYELRSLSVSDLPTVPRPALPRPQAICYTRS